MTKSKLHPSEILKSRNFWWKLLISSVLWDLRFLIKGLVDNCNCGFEWVTALITVFFENLQSHGNRGGGEIVPLPFIETESSPSKYNFPPPSSIFTVCRNGVLRGHFLGVKKQQLKSIWGSVLSIFYGFLIALSTQSQSGKHRRFYQCVKL